MITRRSDFIRLFLQKTFDPIFSHRTDPNLNYDHIIIRHML